MRSPFLTAVLALPLVTAACGLGCGGERPAPRPPVAPLAIGVATAPRETVVKPEPAPVAPADLAMLVRIADPQGLVREVATLLPSSMAGIATELGPAQITTMLFGGPLSGIIDLTQPIDVAGLGDGDAFVFSMAVKQDAEKTPGEDLVLQEERGVVHVREAEGRSALGKMNACVLTPGVGRVTTRLVCGSEEGAVESSAAYLARGLGAEPLDSDVRLMIPGNVFRNQKSSASKVIRDASSTELVAGLGDPFLQELARFDGDVSFTPQGVDLALNLRLSGRTTILSRALVTKTAPAKPPAAFFRLPADAIVAMHTTGGLPEDLAPLRKTLVDALENDLVEDGYDAPKTHELRARIESLFLTGGPLVLGVGVAAGRDGAEKALAAASGAPRSEAAARTALAPWVMFEVEEPPSSWTQGLRDIVRRSDEVDKARKPGSASKKPKNDKGDHIDVKVAGLDPALKLPKDSLHLEIMITPRIKGGRGPHKAHLFVVPKGGSTWIGYCEEAPAIASRLRLALDDATEAGTLTRSAEAAQLRDKLSVGAGFFALEGVGLLTAKTDTSAELQAASTASVTKTQKLGPHGNDIVTWSVSADASAAAPRTSITFQVKRQTVSDTLRRLVF